MEIVDEDFDDTSWYSGSRDSSHSRLSGASVSRLTDWGEPVFREEEFRESIRSLQGKQDFHPHSDVA